IAPIHDLVVHPLGTLTVRQRVVPLGLEIARYGGAQPRDRGPFEIAVQAADGSSGAPEATVEDQFARAQFFDLSEAERLSAPSFEAMAAGARLGGGGLTLPTAGIRDVTGGIVYDEYLLDVDP